jgi:hypothetical protein
MKYKIGRTSMGDEKALLQRVERLEARYHRAKWLIGVLAVCLVAFILALRTWPSDKIRAREFILINRSGEVLARLTKKSSGACFEMTGKNKIATAELCSEDDYGTSLMLMNNRGSSWAILSAGGKVLEPLSTISPELSIGEQNGSNFIRATVGHGTGASSIELTAPQANPRVRLVGSDNKSLWVAP